MLGKVVVCLVVVTLIALTSEVKGHRVKRQVLIRQRNPAPVIPLATPDRSVYARRNFAQPDVVSDVYEVYVGPSNYALGREAVVVLQGIKGVQGSISFLQERQDTPVFLNGTITGLTPGRHGFHIHQKGDLREGCVSAAGHYNPYMQPHGSPVDRNRHIGDLGNIEADATGTARITVVDPLISLSGVNSIIGRAVVVHEKEDDLGLGMGDSLNTGNAGGRLACGVIGLV